MKRTKNEQDSYNNLWALKLEILETERELNMAEFLPEGWSQLEENHPTKPHKQKVTLRVDEDVLKWYRKMGEGYQSRINATLRLYMLARVSKAVETADETSF